MADDFQDSESVPVDFDLDSWLDGAQLAQRSVVIYGRPDLIGEMEALERRLAGAEKDADVDGSLGNPEVSALRDRGEELLTQLEASKSTWYVSGLSPEAGDRLVADYPIPDLPAKPTPKHISDRETAYVTHNLHWIAAAVVKIESADGRIKQGVTYEQMVKLRGRLGDIQIARLKRAAQSAQVEEPHVPTPFSQRKSGTDPT